MTDEAQLFKIALQDACADVRLAAMGKIKNPAYLKAIAIKETDGFIQYELLYEVNDAEVNALYAKSAEWMKTREKATKCLFDQKLLYDIYSGGCHG